MVKKVLIVELNPYHGEILPGFTYLFQQCGYIVDVLIRKEVLQEKPFVYYPAKNLPTIKSGDLGYITKFLQKQSSEYDIIFFSSNVLWERDVNDSSVFRYLGFMPQPKVSALFIEHNMSYLDTDDSNLLWDADRIATLLPYNIDSRVSRFINPHYFGEIKSIYRSHKNPRILVIGTSSLEPYSLKVLFKAIRDNNEKDFELTLVNTHKIEIPSDLKMKISTTPRLKFDEYYNYVESSDYILTVFSSNDKQKDKYLTGTTSGTIQISLGFHKPLIIDKTHAEAYGLTSKESIQFSFNNLSAGIASALSMNKEEYKNMCLTIRKKSEKINEKSILNLESMIDLNYNRGKKFMNIVDKNTILLTERNHKIEVLEIEKNKLITKINSQNEIIDKQKEEIKDLKNHINTLWMHLHLKRFILAEKLYNYLNELAPYGSFRRKVTIAPLKLLLYIKHTPERRLRREKSKFRESFKKELVLKAQDSKSTIVYISMPWDNIMRQRPHHLAEQLSELGHLVVYMDYEATIPRRISDNLVVVDGAWCLDTLKNINRPKYFILPAGYNMPYDEVQEITNKGYSLIYEYIDELDETISGNLVNQLEVFKNLESLNPSVLIASAKKLYNELEARFPEDKLVMNANAVDVSHFNSSKKHSKKDAPIDLRPILELGRPIVGYYGAIAPWLDYNLINELTHKHKDISFVFIGVNYNDGLTNLLTYENVFYLGPKDYNDLPNYSYWFDAAIIPFQRGDIAKSTSPVKLFEYMAMGIPTVCTYDLEECRGYDYVYVSKDTTEFEANIEKAILSKRDAKVRRGLRNQAKQNTWRARAKAISDMLSTSV